MLVLTSAPIGTWKFNFPFVKEVMTDWPTDGLSLTFSLLFSSYLPHYLTHIFYLTTLANLKFPLLSKMWKERLKLLPLSVSPSLSRDIIYMPFKFFLWFWGEFYVVFFSSTTTFWKLVAGVKWPKPNQNQRENRFFWHFYAWLLDGVTGSATPSWRRKTRRSATWLGTAASCAGPRMYCRPTSPCRRQRSGNRYADRLDWKIDPFIKYKHNMFNGRLENNIFIP